MGRGKALSLGAVLLWVVLLGELVDTGVSVGDKCLACQSVAEQIELGLANESPRNHLDLRDRLDSKGQREGKVINYKVSELRVVELLDGLCAKFKSYTLQKGDTGREEWIKVKSENLSAPERQQAETYSKELVSYCGRLMETTDDELTSKIQKGDLKAGDVEAVLCMELSRHCKPPSAVNTNSEELLLTGGGGSDGDL
ncbi:unnamed protein product [Calypogeia fissa]